MAGPGLANRNMQYCVELSEISFGEFVVDFIALKREVRVVTEKLSRQRITCAIKAMCCFIN